MIANERRSLDLSGRRAAQALSRLVAFQRQRFDGVAKLAESAVLQVRAAPRLCAGARREGQARPFTRPRSGSGQALRLEFADGEVKVREDSPKQGRLL